MREDLICITYGAYAHNKVSPSRKKFDPNCKVGFVLGYQEGRLGCKLYYPNLCTVGYTLDIRYNEDIVFKDRYKAEYTDAIGKLSYMNPEDCTVQQVPHDQVDLTERLERLEGEWQYRASGVLRGVENHQGTTMVRGRATKI
ncbi:hypothetical protein PHMEG_00035340 [Phytophthora megakarya]|uniref:Retroviral polymerase SH3-like domain-containing protein n=1 Tax=Phytophthora megakarya TaxID=4795 RepID=A0A225UNX7_9STRA|nr:hypothetical protein PHMEG_00035340 [Phytophthora megakarya]